MEMYYYMHVDFHLFKITQQQANYLVLVFQIVPLLLGLFGSDGQARRGYKLTEERKKKSISLPFQ